MRFLVYQYTTVHFSLNKSKAHTVLSYNIISCKNIKLAAIFLIDWQLMVILKHMLLLLPFLWDFTSQFPLSVLSWLLWSLFWWMYSSVKWFSRVWMWTILCLLLLPFGEREEKHRDRWRRHEKARVLMAHLPYLIEAKQTWLSLIWRTICVFHHRDVPQSCTLCWMSCCEAGRCSLKLMFQQKQWTAERNLFFHQHQFQNCLLPELLHRFNLINFTASQLFSDL